MNTEVVKWKIKFIIKALIKIFNAVVSNTKLEKVIPTKGKLNLVKVAFTPANILYRYFVITPRRIADFPKLKREVKSFPVLIKLLAKS